MEPKRTPQRTPISGTRNKFKIKNQDPAFVYRAVNDVEDRIEQMRELGYEIVTKEIKTGDKVVGTGTHVGTPMSVSVGGGVKAVIMRCPREVYELRAAEKANAVQLMEDALKTPGSNNADYGKVDVRRS